MVAATSLSVVSSDLYNQNKCDLNDFDCSNCVLMEKQLHSALEELESAKLIIKLLQEEIEKDFPHGDRTSKAIKSPKDMSAKVHSDGLENNKWAVITAKCCRKGFSPKNLTEVNNTYPLCTANHYKQLTNLQDTLVKGITLKIQEENNTSDIPNCDHQTKLQYQSRGKMQRIDKKNRILKCTIFQPYSMAK